MNAFTSSIQVQLHLRSGMVDRVFVVMGESP